MMHKTCVRNYDNSSRWKTLGKHKGRMRNVAHMAMKEDHIPLQHSEALGARNTYVGRNKWRKCNFLANLCCALIMTVEC